MGELLVEYIVQVSGPSLRLLDQGPPVRNFPVKCRREIGPVFPYLCQGSLYVVEVVQRLCNYDLHGVDLTNKIPKIFTANETFCVCKINNGKELLKLLL